MIRRTITIAAALLVAIFALSGCSAIRNMTSKATAAATSAAQSVKVAVPDAAPKGPTPAQVAAAAAARRTAYQKAFEAATGSMVSPGYDVVRIGNQLGFVNGVECSNLGDCAIAAKEANGIKLTLPIGYQWTSNVSPLPSEYKVISTLVYWDPYQHKSVTQVAPKNSTVVLPAALVSRTASQAAIHQTVYVSPAFIRLAGKTPVVIPNGGIYPEQLGDIGNHVTTIPLVRLSATKFAGCIGKVTLTTPVMKNQLEIVSNCKK